MKKSIFNLALLSMLFVLGACSVAPTVPGGTGDEVVDGGLSDALDQIGGSDAVNGMDIWSMSAKESAGNITSTCTDILYFSANKFKNILTFTYDGTGDISRIEVTFDNEVAIKSAAEGTLATSTTFKLFNNTGAEITELQGYTTLYTQTSTKETCWVSSKLGGNDKWKSVEARTSYHIVSKVGDKLSMIRISLKTEGKPEDGYTIYGTMDESIKNARTYTKK